MNYSTYRCPQCERQAGVILCAPDGCACKSQDPQMPWERIAVVERERHEKEIAEWRDYATWLRERLEEEQAPWIAEVIGQMQPTIRKLESDLAAAEAERDELLARVPIWGEP